MLFRQESAFRPVDPQLLGQAFDVIFREIKRYAAMLDAFEGVDWEAYARQRN